jgi:hypothetical protein
MNRVIAASATIAAILVATPGAANQCGPAPPWCATCDGAQWAAQSIPAISPWCTSAICPAELEPWLCRADAPMPDACLWVDGLMPSGIQVLCCSRTGKPIDTTCTDDSECPVSPDTCYTPWCGWTGRCLLITTTGTSCDSSGATCANPLDGTPMVCQ